MTLTKDETELDALAIDTIRTLSIDAVEKATRARRWRWPPWPSSCSRAR
jgi:hypothetical protein